MSQAVTRAGHILAAQPRPLRLLRVGVTVSPEIPTPDRDALVAAVQSRTDVPVTATHATAAHAWRQLVFTGPQSLVAVEMGARTLSAARIQSDGQVDAAGERLGHSTVGDPYTSAHACACGRPGHAQTVTSAEGLVGAHADDQALEKALAEAAAQPVPHRTRNTGHPGDPGSPQRFAYAGELLGHVVSNTIAVADPAAVQLLLPAPLAAFRPGTSAHLFVQELRRALKASRLTGNLPDKVQLLPLGDRADPWGHVTTSRRAAALAIGRTFDDQAGPVPAWRSARARGPHGFSVESSPRVAAPHTPVSTPAENAPPETSSVPPGAHPAPLSANLRAAGTLIRLR